MKAFADKVDIDKSVLNSGEAKFTKYWNGLIKIWIAAKVKDLEERKKVDPKALYKKLCDKHKITIKA